jgi:hypothetical protein
LQWLRQYLDSQHPRRPAAPLPLPEPAPEACAESEVLELIHVARAVGRKVVLKRADDGPRLGRYRTHVSEYEGI